MIKRPTFQNEVKKPIILYTWTVLIWGISKIDTLPKMDYNKKLPHKLCEKNKDRENKYIQIKRKKWKAQPFFIFPNSQNMTEYEKKIMFCGVDRCGTI